MSTHPMMSRLLSTGLILSLPFLALPARSADGSATLSGSIVWAADQTPLAGSKLHAGDPKTGEIFSSAPASDEGSFVLDGLPASTYELAVESDGGLYLVGTPLALAPGTAQTLNLAVSRQTLPNYDKEDDDDPRGSPIWDNPGDVVTLTSSETTVWQASRSDRSIRFRRLTRVSSGDSGERAPIPSVTSTPQRPHSPSAPLALAIGRPAFRTAVHNVVPGATVTLAPDGRQRTRTSMGSIIRDDRRRKKAHRAALRRATAAIWPPLPPSIQWPPCPLPASS